MKMVIADYWNQYNVNGKFVEDIVLYDESGMVLQTDSTYLSGEYGGAIKSIPEVEKVARRRLVNLNRREHFTCTMDGKHTLFLYLGAFKSVRIIDKELRYTYPCEVVYSKAVHLEIDGKEVVVTSRLERYITREPTPEAPLIQEIVEYFNTEVADHRNRGLTDSMAARLIEALPRMAEAVERHKAGNL